MNPNVTLFIKILSSILNSLKNIQISQNLKSVIEESVMHKVVGDKQYTYTIYILNDNHIFLKRSCGNLLRSYQDFVESIEYYNLLKNRILYLYNNHNCKGQDIIYSMEGALYNIRDKVFNVCRDFTITNKKTVPNTFTNKGFSNPLDIDKLKTYKYYINDLILEIQRLENNNPIILFKNEFLTIYKFEDLINQELFEGESEIGDINGGAQDFKKDTLDRKTKDNKNGALDGERTDVLKKDTINEKTKDIKKDSIEKELTDVFNKDSLDIKANIFKKNSLDETNLKSQHFTNNTLLNKTTTSKPQQTSYSTFIKTLKLPTITDLKSIYNYSMVAFFSTSIYVFGYMFYKRVVNY